MTLYGQKPCPVCGSTTVPCEPVDADLVQAVLDAADAEAGLLEAEGYGDDLHHPLLAAVRALRAARTEQHNYPLARLRDALAAYNADAPRREAERAVLDAADKLERHPLANEYAVGWVAFADLLACVRIHRDVEVSGGWTGGESCHATDATWSASAAHFVDADLVTAVLDAADATERSHARMLAARACPPCKCAQCAAVRALRAARPEGDT